MWEGLITLFVGGFSQTLHRIGRNWSDFLDQRAGLVRLSVGVGRIG